MDQTTHQQDIAKLTALIAQLERRISLIEDRLSPSGSSAETPIAEDASPVRVSSAEAEDELEYQVGQNWFAKTGIVVLAFGMGFLLTLPIQGIPSYFPPLIGGVCALGLYALERAWRESYPLLAKYIFGAGMALMYFAALRLCFFSPSPVLSASSVPGTAILFAASILASVLALRRRSTSLFALALTCVVLSILVTGSTWIPVIAFPLAGAFLSTVRTQFKSSGLHILGMAVLFVGILLEGVNNPLLGRTLQLTASPLWISSLVIPTLLAVAIGTLTRRDHRPEEWMQGAESIAAIVLGYGTLSLCSLSAEPPVIVGIHLACSGLFLGLAIAFWIKERSTIATFFFAMAGYLALSIALARQFSAPAVFVWLALQSIVVVATAVWFRSRFIVVANFCIYLVIILSYLIAVQEEHGLTLGFGVVALVSARILNWKKHRLALKTESMRNAYLAIAFLAFPYALYHLVPHEYVSLSWIGIAGLYYALNGVIKVQKYRWMGHFTLMITVLYVVVIGIIQLDPVYRIVSFLALAVALLAVSMAFTRLRSRRSLPVMKAPPPVRPAARADAHESHRS